MAKSTNVLEFISILQFSQMHLIFEISISKEIKKIIAKSCKKTLNVLQFSAFLGAHKGFLIAIMLFALICAHALTHRSRCSTRLPTPGSAFLGSFLCSVLITSVYGSG